MLYIFHVDTGTTITFDMKLALESVAQLKEAIERECGVAAGQQVLLVSGGESLEPNTRVCTYSAGTDTNPIYLFSKASIESHQPPIPSIDYGSDVDLQAQIEASLAMPATYQTVVTRAQLGQQCFALAREQTRICERLVHDQHLQQQGWAAVVANLEDITQMFQSKADLLQQNFMHYLAERQQHINLSNNFNEDLGMLSKIPILPALRAHAEGLLSPEDQENEDSTQSSEALSLLKWISAKDNQSSLEQVAEQCSRGLEQFDEKVMECLKGEVSVAVEAANKQDMKEIKGLGERLFGLEQLMFETKKLVQEQSDLAHAFLQNQNRASNLGDASILPDLCASHRRQLMFMLQNHNHLRDIRRRCTKAKEELSVNLYHRLKWIMYVENKMMEVDGKLVMYHESLKRLRRHLELLQQIHLAPEMYMSAVAEVVRRRTFSQAFLVWASNLACQLLTVHSEEIARRRDFKSKFEGHFLNTLFPGLEDTPPPFATQAPSVFDSSLPKLTSDDMESLQETLPDLALIVSSPDLNSITQFFLSRSLTEGSSDASKDKEGQQSPDASKNMAQRRAPLLSDRGGFESETDTEEFEKIGQNGAEMKRLNSYESESRQDTKDKLQSEENLGNTREEVERLRSVVRCMKSVAGEALIAFRQELASIREQTCADKGSLNELTEGVRRALELHSAECERTIQEKEQALTVDHELEMGDLKKIMQSRDEEIRSLKQNILEKESEHLERERLIAALKQKIDSDQSEFRAFQSRNLIIEEALERAQLDKELALKETQDASQQEITELNEKIARSEEQIRKLEERLNASRTEREEAIKNATDKFQKEYKTELDTIRSRFRLMAASNMERSPSDSSLEKIERPDMIELVNHEAIVAQMKEDLKAEKVTAIRAAIEKERTECAAKLDHELRLTRQRNDAERQVWFNEAMRRVVEEKERQVENHRSREVLLSEECERYKETIRRLAESENMVRQTLSETVESLEADKVRLEANMEADKNTLKEQETRLRNLESERDKLREELCNERLKMSHGGTTGLEETVKILEAKNERLENIKAGADSRLLKLEAEKDKLKAELEIHRKNDDIEVSESKKVRLESEPDIEDILRRADLLESENKRLNNDYRILRENKELLETKIGVLENEKDNLEVELVKERSRQNFPADNIAPASLTIAINQDPRDKDMTASVAVVPESSSRDAATSPEPSRRDTSAHLKDKLTRSTANLIQQARISISSCNPGDVILVVWDTQHRNYILLQESSTLFFLHSDCIDSLDLRLNSDASPKKMYAVGEVIDKEYCHAKKPENRYRVPQGTKFYRVRVRPQQKDNGSSMTTSTKIASSQSQSQSH